MLADMATTLGMTQNDALGTCYESKLQNFILRLHRNRLGPYTEPVKSFKNRSQRGFYGSRTWLPPPWKNRKFKLTTLFYLFFRFFLSAIILNRYDSTSEEVKLLEIEWQTVARCVADMPTTTLTLPRI